MLFTKVEIRTSDEFMSRILGLEFAFNGNVRRQIEIILRLAIVRVTICLSMKRVIVCFFVVMAHCHFIV